MTSRLLSSLHNIVLPLTTTLTRLQGDRLARLVECQVEVRAIIGQPSRGRPPPRSFACNLHPQQLREE